MNDIDKMPVKCRDCPYWELAVYPWYCGNCTDRLKKPVSDFVSRQWLIDEYHRRHEGPPGGALKMIEEAPAADVEPVVRCENCQFFENVEYWPDGTKKVCQLLKRQVLENSFCCWGMKKEDDDAD